jgi:AraC-like DNA-binding protein/ligand-binding sensor protein
VQFNPAITQASGLSGGPSQGRPSADLEVGATLLLRLQQSDLFRDYQKAFEVTTGLPLILRETGSFRTPLQGSKRVNKFCTLMVRTNKSCAACLQLQQRLEEEATREPRTLQCHAGLNESAVPVRVGNRVLGYLQTGQVFFRTPSENRFKSIGALLGEGKTVVGAREMKAAYFQTRVVNRKQYESVIRLLVIFARHLATVSNQILMTEEAAEPSAITRGRTFIAEHHSEQLSLNDVARAVKMSVCYFCRVFKKATGLTFTEYLARERIESVKQLLLNVNMRVSEAAFAAGFQSLSQFNRVFRRVEGESPSTYRERLHGICRPPDGSAGFGNAA